MGVPSQEMRSRGVVPDTGCLAKRVDRQGRKEGRNKKHLETVAMRCHERPWDFGSLGFPTIFRLSHLKRRCMRYLGRLMD